MKLRLIFLVLSLLAILSVSAGSYFYYTSLKEAAFKEAEHHAVTRVEIIQKNLSTFLRENIRPVRTLAGLPQVSAFLKESGPRTFSRVEALLDHFNHTLKADVCYLLDASGTTVASSNRHAPDSFVGKNFAFRPYFQQALAGRPATYLALGTTSGRRGVYCSHPVYVEDEDEPPSGVVVIKTSLEEIEKKLGQSRDEVILVTDPHGLVFIASRRSWLFKLLWRCPAPVLAALRRSRQFGPGPWEWAGLRRDGEHYAVDRGGRRYFLNRLEIDGFPGWSVVYLRSLKAIYKVVFDPLVRVTIPTMATLCLLVGLAVFFLYHKASIEIVQRRQAEEALRQSEERYRSIYHKTPAMLHSINPDGNLVSVSDHWLEALDYRRDEVVGRPLFDFLDPESRRLAREQVFPEFFRTGRCKDVPYRLVRRDGSCMDVLLSAIGDRDEAGRIVRSLAVSIDISARKKAEEELKKARDELSRYSRDLERQVRKRTAEIRRLSGGIMAAQEQERAAIARGLHDELGQVLTALRLEAVWLAERVKALDEKAADRARMMVRLIDDTIDEVRSIALRLRPRILDDLGLIEALEWYTADFERRTGIACTFAAAGALPDLDDRLATAAYRITQEALTNVARHAAADQVGVRLKVMDSCLEISVVDNGRGFDPDGPAAAGGLGIAGMRERAMLVGGTFTISSRPGHGVRVVFRVGLEPGDPGRNA